MLGRVRAAWNSIDEVWGRDMENAFTRGVAECVLADPGAAAMLATQQVSVETTLGWQDVNPTNFSKLLMAVAFWKRNKFYNVVLNLVHDRLDASIGNPAEAIEAENQRGDHWTLAGDKSLADSPETLTISKAAVAQSFRNLADAALTTETQGDQQMIEEVMEVHAEADGSRRSQYGEDDRGDAGSHRAAGHRGVRRQDDRDLGRRDPRAAGRELPAGQGGHHPVSAGAACRPVPAGAALRPVPADAARVRPIGDALASDQARRHVATRLGCLAGDLTSSELEVVTSQRWHRTEAVIPNDDNGSGPSDRGDPIGHRGR